MAKKKINKKAFFQNLCRNFAQVALFFVENIKREYTIIKGKIFVKPQN